LEDAMKNAIAYIAIASTLLFGGNALAQDASTLAATGYHAPKSLYFLNWEITKPVGNFANYTDSTSLRGFSFEGRNFVRDNVSVGLSFSWNRFYQTFDNASFDINNGTVTGPVYRDAEMFAVRGLAHFYLMKGPLRPYVGAGIGGSWDYAYQQSADLSRSQSNFDFIVSPEAGLMYNIERGWSTIGLNLALRYTYTTATVGSIHDTQSAGLILGLAFGY
jgi:hypothetical protein